MAKFRRHSKKIYFYLRYQILIFSKLTLVQISHVSHRSVIRFAEPDDSGAASHVLLCTENKK